MYHALMTTDRTVARRRLDARSALMRQVVDQPRPHRGWIRAIRDALGMSSAELAARMNVTQQNVSELEQREVRGTVTLDTLRRAADALDCDIVYALVPRTSLEEAVRAQASRKATQLLQPVAHHSRIENQSLDGDVATEQLDELAARFIDRRGLWTDEAKPAP